MIDLREGHRADDRKSYSPGRVLMETDHTLK